MDLDILDILVEFHQKNIEHWSELYYIMGR